MTAEETIQQELASRFDFLRETIRIARPRRIFASAPRERFTEVFDYAIENLDFPILCTITGLDEGENLAAIYHLAQENGITLSLKTTVPKTAPDLPTVTARFPAAEAYERELVDMLGFNVIGLAPGRRYPLPDDWPAGQYPLRKDWSPEMLDAGRKE
jgi:Ni,Fe-hydrogenase III component G